MTLHGSGHRVLAERLLRELERRVGRDTEVAVDTWLQADPRMAHDEIHGGGRILRGTAGSPGTWFRSCGTQATRPTIRHTAARAGHDRCVTLMERLG